MRNLCLVLCVVLGVMFCVESSSGQAVRVINGNACGSGSVCGYDADGAYVLTNAHVAGTSPGATMRVQYDFGLGSVTASGRLLMAAYSDRTLSDWAILRVGELKSGPSWKLSSTLPSGSHFLTCGSPRCVWPLVCGDVSAGSASDASVLWQWKPNAIGGQSGSSVRTADGVTKGLLTWSWGGNGAGQTTRSIFLSVKSRSLDGTPRPAGLVEVAGPLRRFGERVRGRLRSAGRGVGCAGSAVSGYAPLVSGSVSGCGDGGAVLKGDACAVCLGVVDPPQSSRAVTEVGFFSEAGVVDLPIWDVGQPPPPPPSGELRSAVEAAGISWDQFVKFVIDLYKLFKP